MKHTLILSLLLLSNVVQLHAQFSVQAGMPIQVDCRDASPVVHTAINILAKDYEQVFSAPLIHADHAGQVIISTIDQADEACVDTASRNFLKAHRQAFVLKVLPSRQLAIVGSDAHGAAYGVMELSRLIGVSPWEWWADVTPLKQASFRLKKGFEMKQAPSVEYRGIFINDEDWGLMPWSTKSYEPTADAGKIGPRTHERIFELLLRLRANTFWPAMHECTYPFFLTEGNREVARKYGIYIGGSHCEPMASSTAGEWRRRGKGDYDYVHNRQQVLQFWEERVREVARQEIIYTLGMRGVHDGRMQGAKTNEEQRAVLEQVFTAQRAMLQKYVHPDVTRVPQVFIPYKEVLDVYRTGLPVPDDVTLMWCDDNYGYIRHFPTPEERQRAGGNGIYYHVSYWGRPHDYLWLGTFSPALLYEQMSLAYAKGIRKMWVLNVGDIKPLEYQVELFMDMAWDIDAVRKQGVDKHLEHFMQREFGADVAKPLARIMTHYYRLAFIRKPEFMGNTREEQQPREVYRKVKDLPWSRAYIQERRSEYKKLSDAVENLAGKIPQERAYAYFQLVKYPVQAATQMNEKFLCGQLARHGEMEWERSDEAYDSIVHLTRLYNDGFDRSMKWNGMMSHQPRRLPMFERLQHDITDSPWHEERPLLFKWNAVDGKQGSVSPCVNLGYEGGAVSLVQNEPIYFDFRLKNKDSVQVELNFLPTHPVHGSRLRVKVSLDGQEAHVISYETQGRSEEWKENVLRNRAVRTLTLPVDEGRRHRLCVEALDGGVVLDQIVLYK